LPAAAKRACSYAIVAGRRTGTYFPRQVILLQRENAKLQWPNAK